ncbi:MAG: tetratricopeptide repeat protein [Bryobacteraceae bacterium]
MGRPEIGAESGLLSRNRKQRRAARKLDRRPNALRDVQEIFDDALRGRIDDAVALYKRGLALKPDYADAHSNLGVALLVLRGYIGCRKPPATGRSERRKPDWQGISAVSLGPGCGVGRYSIQPHFPPCSLLSPLQKDNLAFDQGILILLIVWRFSARPRRGLSNYFMKLPLC